jgi:hypothetical protein
LSRKNVTVAALCCVGVVKNLIKTPILFEFVGNGKERDNRK